MRPSEHSAVDQRHTHRRNVEGSERVAKIEAGGYCGSGPNDQEPMLNFFDPGEWLATKRRGLERDKAKCEHNPPPCLRNEVLNLAHAITGLDSQEKNARSEAVYRKLAAVAERRMIRGGVLYTELAEPRSPVAHPGPHGVQNSANLTAAGSTFGGSRSGRPTVLTR